MFIEKVPAGIYKINCYVIAEDESAKCAVIDPGGDAQDIEKVIDDNGFTLEYILLTHGHADHIGAVGELKEKYQVPVLAHRLEAPLLADPKQNLSDRMGAQPISIVPDRLLEEKDSILLGELRLEVLHTPGHTPGGICLLAEDMIFTGDTLFAGSIGRVDLAGGSEEEMKRSLRKLRELSDEWILLPGHGPASRMGIEKHTNSYLIKA